MPLAMGSYSDSGRVCSVGPYVAFDIKAHGFRLKLSLCHVWRDFIVV